MSSKSAAQHSANILPFQWEGLQATLAASHPNETYTAGQRYFLTQFLGKDDKLSNIAHLSLTMLRDEWAYALPQNKIADLVPFRNLSTAEKLQYIVNMREPLQRKLQQRQEEMPIEGLKPGMDKFKFLEIDAEDMNVSFLLVIGMWLAYRQFPESESWHIAGKAYLLGQICKITFLALHSDANDEIPMHVRTDDDNFVSSDEDSDNSDETSEQSDDENRQLPRLLETFVSNNTHTNQLKLCVFAVWHNHYSDGEKFSKNLMIGAWLQEALKRFTDILYLRFSADCFPPIAATAGNWITDLSSNAKLTSRVKPTGAWDEAVAGKTAERKVWINYFSILIAEKKCAALETARPHSEAVGESAAARSRKRNRHSILSSPSGISISGGTSSSAQESIISLLDKSQRDDRDWLAQMQQEANDREDRKSEREDQRHREVMESFQQQSRVTNELMMLLRTAITTHAPQPPHYTSNSYPSPPQYYTATSPLTYRVLDNNNSNK